MQNFRFIHAADLHLDAAFRGISNQAPAIAHELQQATFNALSRLERLCLEKQPDALLIAGDLYNKEDGSLKAQLAVRDMCRRLDRADIAVCIVHGNHDPLSSRMKTLQWPENTVIFPREGGSRVIFRNDTPVAVVHGVSHATEHEEESLVPLFKKAAFLSVNGQSIDCTRLPQLGLLHCTLEDSAERYAPTSLAELESTGMDYWALGHTHSPTQRGRNNHIVYSGSCQGLQINEDGPHGCFEVTLENGHISRNFRPLAPVEWYHVRTDIARLDGAAYTDIHDVLLEDIQNALRNSHADLALVRLSLTGRGDADLILRKSQYADDLLDELRKNETANQGNRFWVKDLILESRPAADIASLREQRDDLLGECLRVAEELRSSPDAFTTHCADLFAELRKEKILFGMLEALSPDELTNLLEEAELTCIEMLDMQASDTVKIRGAR